MKKHLTKAPQFLLGLIYFASGLAGLFNLAPPPADLPPKMIQFMDGMMAATYFFPFLKLTETVFGLLLVVRQFSTLSLIVLAPITINIILVHAFLTPGLSNLIVPVVLLALHLAAAHQYRPVYLPLLKRTV